VKKTEKMTKKKGKNRKTKNRYKTNAYTTVLSWMNLYFLSLDYCDAYTTSDEKGRFMVQFFLGRVSDWCL
jgi:hypothetical protein